MNQKRFAKITIVTATLACAFLAAGATGMAVAADVPAAAPYHHDAYVGPGWGWDNPVLAWDSGPYAGYVGTDWGNHGAQPIGDPYAGLRHVGAGYYPRYVPLGAAFHYSYPGLW